MKCFRSIVLVGALLLCLVQLCQARPAEDTDVAQKFDPNELLQSLEAGVQQAYKTLDDLKSHPVIAELNQHGTQLVFEAYRALMKVYQFLAAQHFQGEQAPAEAEAAPAE